MKKILLIGGAGYVGSVLTEDLLDKNFNVTVLDKLLYNNKYAIKKFLTKKNFNFVNGDFCNINSLNLSLKDVTDVVILGGLVGDPITLKYPKLNQTINIDGIKNCVNYLNNKNLDKLLFISTCSNYGLIKQNISADENYELKPLSLYAKAKVEIENYILNKSKNSIDYDPVILRYATAFGLSPRMRFDLTVNEFTFELMNDQLLEVYDADTWRPYCHVKDFSRLIINILKKKKNTLAFEIFNCGSNSNNHTKRNIVKLISKKIPNAKIKYREKDKDPRNYRVDFSKIKKYLNFQTKYTVSDGIDELIKNFHLFKEKDKKLFGNYEIEK